MKRPKLELVSADDQFSHHRTAALALLNRRTDLTFKQARFLAQVSVTTNPSDRQLGWLSDLLAESHLPPLTDGKQ